MLSVLHCSVDRVVFVFGGRVKDPVNDVTPTFLTDRILATLRSADSIVNKILHESGNKTISLTFVIPGIKNL